MNPQVSGPPLQTGLRIGDVTIPSRVLVAPMTGVSDLPFRRACVKAGAAYVATEMVACTELVRGRPDVVRRAAVGEGLPLTVIQLVGADPEMIAQGAAMAERAGAHIVDLNFGCPAKVVTGAACGSALMRDMETARRIVEAAVAATTRPVTVKIRLGWDEADRNAPAFAAMAQAAGAAAVTVHGRTRRQQYSGEADWVAVAQVKAEVCIPVIVNGDVIDAASAREALARSGADGVMLGRGVYGRPWLAADLDAALAQGAPSPGPAPVSVSGPRLEIALEHFADTLCFYGDRLGLRIFRKHLGWYVQAAPCAADEAARRAARACLCRLEDARSVERALTDWWVTGGAEPRAEAA